MMNKLAKGALLLLPALVLAGGLSTSVMADNHGGKRDHKGAGCERGDKRGGKFAQRAATDSSVKAERMVMMLSYKLDLTDAQETALKDIVEQQKVDHKGQREVMAVMLADLAKLEPGSDAYNQQVDTIAATKSDSWAKGMKARGQMWADIGDMLNAEQKAEFKQLMENMKHRMGGKIKQVTGAWAL